MNLLLIGLIFIFQACASKFVRPPSEKFIAEITDHIKKGATPAEEKNAEGITRDYYLAMSLMTSDPQKSCELFSRINNQEIYPKVFALKDLAIIKQMNVCKMNSDEAKIFWKKYPFQEMPTWAQEDYFRGAQTLSERNSDKEWYAEWTFKLAKFEKIQPDKEKYIQISMAIAQSLKLEEKFKQYQNELIKISPRFENTQTNVETDRLYKIAYDYEKNRKFKEARVTYEKIIQNDKNEITIRIKALQRILFCFKKDRDNDNYILARKRFVHFFEDLIKKFPEEKKYQRYKTHSALRFARAKWSKIGREEARPYIQSLLLSLENETPKSKGFLAQSHWLLGNMMLEEKRNQEAMIHFSDGLKLCQKDRPLCHNLAWSVGLAKYSQNKFEEAETVMREFLLKIKNRSEHQRFIFWLAKALKKENKMDEAEALFQELITYDAYSYYALISYRELNQSVPEIEVDDNVERLKNNDFEWALALGENNIALKILDISSKKIKTSEEREKIIPLYAKLGAYQNALMEFQKLPEKYRKENFGRNAPFIFPFAFETEIKKNSQKFSVPYSLIASIIRQESSFNQFARSPADAFGPMQLIPEAAKIISKKYKIPYLEIKDLYNPEINIALGAALLRDLMNDNQSRLIPVAASYNAGSAPVKRWENERQNSICVGRQCNIEEYFEEGMKFIESIPYEETKKYVKLVFRNMVIYQVLEKKESLPLPIYYFYSLSGVP